MATNWVDRRPTYPNRYKVTKSDGSIEYITLERADEPTVEGTPINAENLNALEKGAAAGLVAMPKAGGEFTGAIKVASPLKLAGVNYPAIDIYKSSVDNRVASIAYDSVIRKFYFTSYATDMDNAGSRYPTKYFLPAAPQGLTAEKSCNIMTSEGGTFTGNVKAHETERTDRGLFNEETRKGSTTGTAQSVKYFINVID